MAVACIPDLNTRIRIGCLGAKARGQIVAIWRPGDILKYLRRALARIKELLGRDTPDLEKQIETVLLRHKNRHLRSIGRPANPCRPLPIPMVVFRRQFLEEKSASR